MTGLFGNVSVMSASPKWVTTQNSMLQVFPFPGRDETYQVPFSWVVYIELDDFREQDQKKYFGLAPGKSVLLRWAHARLL